MKKFTVSEVRELAKHMESVGWRPDSNGDPDCYDEGAARSAEMLRAYADRLEAQEKAVPVAWCRFLVADESGPEGFDPGDIIDLDIHPHAERPEGNGWQAMFLDATQAQPPAARVTDAETLIGQHVSCIHAEALAIQKGVNPLNCAERIVGRCDKLAEKIRESAQPPADGIRRPSPEWFDERLHEELMPPPPAASVTDAMVNAAMLAYNVECHSQGDATNARADGMRAALGVALAAQENPNG